MIHLAVIAGENPASVRQFGIDDPQLTAGLRPSSTEEATNEYLAKIRAWRGPPAYNHDLTGIRASSLAASLKERRLQQKQSNRQLRSFERKFGFAPGSIGNGWTPVR